MKQSLYLPALLLVSGLISFAIGVGLLFFPVSFEASAGIDLYGQVSLLSEIRGMGGLLLVIGIIIILGAYKTAFTTYSLLLTTLFYLSYGFSRGYSILLDGWPSPTLVMAAIAEVCIGLLAGVAFYQLKKMPLPQNP